MWSRLWISELLVCGDSAAQTAITEGNFVPTLVEWLSEGVKIALESNREGGELAEGNVDAAAAAAAGAMAAEFYEGSARALRRLQPAEAKAAGVDVDHIAANYMLQAAVGYANGENFFAAAKAFVQVAATDVGSRRQHNYGVVMDLGCEAAVQFVTVGLTVLQSEVLTRPVMRSGFSGSTWQTYEREQAAVNKAVEEAVVVVGGSARRCSLGPVLEQRLLLLGIK